MIVLISIYYIEIMSAKNPGGVSVRDKQIHELLKLEELFHSHYLTEELINGMVNLYVKFTQNILNNQLSIRLYFMQKIKFVLSRSEVIRILEKKNNQENKNIRQGTKVKGQLTEEQQMEMKKIAEEAKEQIRRNHNINGKKQRVYVNTAKGEQLRDKQRNMQIEMQIQIMEQVEQNMKALNNGESWKNKEKQINKIVQNQDNALQERLAKRKKKLRKRSVQLQDKEVIELEAPPPLDKKQLLEMKKQLNQTYERFTRLTMNKTQRITQLGRQNEGRVKEKVKQAPIYQEDIFDELEKQKVHKVQEPNSFSKNKKKAPEPIIISSESIPDKKVEKKQQQKIQKPKQQIIERQADSTIEYKAFDQNKGRVTVRQKNYEQIEDEQLF